MYKVCGEWGCFLDGTGGCKGMLRLRDIISGHVLLPGDSVYRQKYERTKKELEYTMKSLEKEHQDEMEMQKNTKKQIDKRVRWGMS